jgi:antitoxin ParD1/3/4
MNVALSPTLEKEVASLIQGGRYGNQSEVMRAGLRLLLDQEAARVKPEAKPEEKPDELAKLTRDERREVNELRQIREDRGKLGRLNAERLAELEAKAKA